MTASSREVGKMWAGEIDRRVRRALDDEGSGMTRGELEAILALPPREARERVAAIIASRR